MAFPFKTGGDFYNCEAQRMRLHNLGANPTETATGLMYFNTGASNLGKHAVVHDGTNFKALAFVDEIATNAEFVELKEKVDLLIGDDVDTDTIIDSWKEVQAFLADIEDTKTLQGMLSSYLPKSGGTIESAQSIPLYIKSGHGTECAIGFGANNTKGYGYLVFKGGDAWAVTKEQWSAEYTLIHSGNYSDYALPLSGGTISGSLEAKDTGIGVPITANTENNSYIAIALCVQDSRKARVGWDKKNGAFLINDTTGHYLKIIDSSIGFYNGTNHTLLHSGNIGEYALKTDGSNNMKGGISWGKSTSQTWNVFSPDAGKGIQILNTVGGSSEGAISDYAVGLAVSGYYGFCLGYDALMNTCVFKGGNSNFGDWKTIAFTDSTVAAATRLEDGSGKYIAYVDTNNSRFYIGDNINSTTDMYLLGKNIQLRYGTSGTTGLILNSSGNVLIDTTTDNGNKLQVAGNVDITDKLFCKNQIYTGVGLANGLYLYGGNTTGIAWHQNTVYKSTVLSFNPSTGETTIHGDLHVDGNIIATKEVSAGGVGQEGESGDGGAEVISQQLASGQSTYTITNTIKRSDIAVSLYEWNANNGSWDMCLADISVKDATITVTFGSATSVNHKLVAVG